MNEQLPLYTTVRSGASIYLGRIAQLRVQEGPPDSGREIVELEIKIEETLYGESGKRLRRCKLSRPASETTRLKFPDPIWGQVDLREDLRILFMTNELSEEPADPLYVEEVPSLDDPTLAAVRILLKQEQVEEDHSQRFSRYLQYLTVGPNVQTLFGAEALARDIDLEEVDREGRVAASMTGIFASDQEIPTRLSVGVSMWENIYPRTNSEGRVSIINATIKGAEDPSEDIRNFSRDHLQQTDPEDLMQPGVSKSPAAVKLMKKQLELETAPEAQAQIEKIIEALG